MRRWTGIVAGLLSALVSVTAAAAEDSAPPQDISFAGGTITIAETPDYEKVVSFDGTEIGRDYQAWFDRIVTVAGTDVALISIGPGGNACGANTLLVWPDGSGGVNADKLPGDCGWPLPAVSDYAIFFVPWVGPGEEESVRRWTPGGGFEMPGLLRFAPEPDTGWGDLARMLPAHPVRYFSNAAFLAFAQSALGDDLAQYASGLGTAAEPRKIDGGLQIARGCQPHNCGGADAFMVVAPDARTAWFAQIREGGMEYWPTLAQWTPEARAALAMLEKE